MPLVDICCPLCLQQGKRVQLSTNDGARMICQNGCQLDRGDESNGGISGGIMDHKLESFSGKKFQPAPPPPPANAISFQLALPADVRDRLKEKYADRLEATLAQVLDALSRPSCFLLPGEEVVNLGMLLKQKVENIAALRGAVYSVTQQLVDAKAELEAAVKSQGTSTPAGQNGPGLTIDISPDTLIKIAEKAAFNGIAVRRYISEGLEYAIRENWFVWILTPLILVPLCLH